MELYPLKFEPIFKPVIWGGNKICAFKNISADNRPIGESWEISDIEGSVSIVENGKLKGKSLDELLEIYQDRLVGKSVFDTFGTKFPLLIKFIDASDSLSIQVHPDDDLAKKRHNSCGKTEMWYVIEASQEAFIYSGFSKQLNPTNYLQAVENNTFIDYLQKHKVKANEVFFIPSGRVHALGAGCLVAEIQQTSNITYRIYDYNRKNKQGELRELHTDLAKDAIDYKIYPNWKIEHQEGQNVQEHLITCPYFTSNLFDLKQGDPFQRENQGSFFIYICIMGSCEIKDKKGHTILIKQGETVLIPAECEDIELKATENCKLLEAFI